MTKIWSMKRFVLSAILIAAIAVQSCVDTARIDELDSRITKLESLSYIDAVQDADGRWYWTLNGSWLYVNGAKVPVSVGDGVTPKMKIENWMWYVSYDNGTTWTETGKAKGDDAGIVSITEEGGYVYFGMADGTIITVAKRLPLTISFDSEDVAITIGGASKAIGYTLAGASEKVVIKTIVQDGWKAKVVQKSSETGIIEITAPEPLVESEVLVFVSDGGQTALAAINCVKATVVISQEKYEVSAAGGNIEVAAQTNTGFNVLIPDEAKLWLSYARTKAMTAKTFCLVATENDKAYSRSAVVSLADDAGNIISSFVVLQSGNMEGLISVQCDKKGELHSVLEPYTKITKLKISGVLNDVDFLYIHRLSSLRYLDISDVDILVLPNASFKNSTNVTTIILPKTLLFIPKECFYESSISGELVIPASCQYIEQDAFYNCTSLEHVSFESGSRLQSIEQCAFEYCNLESITIPASCETMGSNVFCSESLKNVSFESGSQLKELDATFRECNALKSIVIPASCESLWFTFKNCKNLEEVIFESGSKLRAITSGYSSGTFEGCAALKSISIPASCETISYYTFKGCKSLTSVGFSPDCPLTALGSGAFAECSSLKSIKIPASVQTLGTECFYGCSFLTDLFFEENSQLSAIGESAFSGCRLRNINMQNCSKLANIGDEAFANNSKQIGLVQIGAVIPPQLGRGVFKYSLSDFSILKVPSGSEYAYYTSNYDEYSSWCLFSSITAID